MRDLAPALLGAADLLQDLNRRINPTAPTLSVIVRATAPGSFVSDLAVGYGADKDEALLSDAAMAGTLAALGAGVGGLFRLIKSRRQAAHVEPDIAEPGDYRIVYPDATSVVIPRAVFDASQDVKIQHDVRQLCRPLETDGTESLTVRQDGTVIVAVDRSDMADFAVQGEGGARPLSVNEREKLLTIRTILFSSDTWQFSDGGSIFNAKLQDGDFLARVNRGEPFSKLDLLRCLIREALCFSRS